MQKVPDLHRSPSNWDAGEYGREEEIANAVTHGLGALLSISGLVVLLVLSAADPDPFRTVSAVVYSASLCLLFLISTLYHSPLPPRMKKLLQILDHCAIYLLIAGTYTPFLLISLKGVWRYTLLAIVWGLALSGIVFKALFRDRFEKLSLLTYIAMGWLVVVVIEEMIAKVPATALVLVVVGGVVYTLGTIPYALERIPYNHAIWHLFVLGGSVFHYLAVYQVIASTTIV